MNEADLKAKGFQLQADGSYRKPVAGLPNPKREQVAVETLDRGSPRQTKGSDGRFFRIIIVSYRARKIDFTNLVGGAKAIQDEIAGRLGIDDGDVRHTWEFEQVITKAASGTHVLISLT